MAEKKQILKVDGLDIVVKQIEDKDYISLTDMAKSRNNQTTDTVIQAWIKRGNTLRFIELWELEHNPEFKPLQMQGIKIELAQEANYVSASQLIDRANIVGIQSRRGRYGGTFAQRDIAFEFASWLSPEFKYYLIKEFQRLKSEEHQRTKLEWDASRFLSKVNYTLQTEAIETRLIPKLQGKEKALAYASEADLINLALFGQTAKQWRAENPDAKGNIRDGASIRQLIILSNLETHNSYLIMAGASKEARYARLCEIAESQLEIFSRDKRLNDDKRFLE